MTTTMEPVALPSPEGVTRRTHVVDRTTTRPEPERRRALAGARVTDLLALVGAAISSLSLTTVLTTQVAPIRSGLGFTVVALVLFVALYAVLVSLDESLVAVKDRVVTVVVHSLAFIVLATLVFIVVFTFARGAAALPFASFYTQDMSLAGPLDPLDVGGVVHAIAGSLIQIAIALAVTIPLGLATAVFLSEIPGRFSSFVRTIVEAMTALPSIVAGLFIYATAILALGVEKSGLAASLSISIMMLPIMIRSSDVVLRLVPGTLKEASIALGAGQWRTVWQVVLPTTRSGLTTAVILATARGIGETSPVLLTSGFTASLNLDPLSGPMVSLPLAIFQFVKSPEPTMIARGFGTAAVLMSLVVLLFAVARLAAGRTPARKEALRTRRAARIDVVRRLVRTVRAAATVVASLLARRRRVPSPQENP